MNPLNDLIVGRGFDRFQTGLESRFGDLGYKHVYGEATNRTCMYLDFESETQLGRVTVWVSGECELHVVDKQSEEDVLLETHHYKSDREFMSRYPMLVNFMRASSNS